MSAKAERLVNLTVALLAASRPLTFAELRSRMGEWQDGDRESQRRKFERDKDELRRLGVPIETVTTDALGGEAAYVVDAEQYALPDLDLSVDQMTVLAVAFQLVDGGADRVAFSKVAARAPDPTDASTPSGVRVRAEDLAAVEPLAQAVADRRVVRFRYRSGSGETSDREVEPTALVSRRGRWYLRGHDRARDDARTFRADRVVGAVTVTDEPSTATASGEDVAADLFTSSDEVTIDVAVRDGDGWRTEQRRDQPLRATARALGAVPDEVVLAPPAARADVVEGLRSVLAAHEGAAP